MNYYVYLILAKTKVMFDGKMQNSDLSLFFFATFSNISAISWRPVLVVEEAGENHRPWASNWYTLSLAACESSAQNSGFALCNKWPKWLGRLYFTNAPYIKCCYRHENTQLSNGLRHFASGFEKEIKNYFLFISSGECSPCHWWITSSRWP